MENIKIKCGETLKWSAKKFLKQKVLFFQLI
jgi:hypothetical protein